MNKKVLIVEDDETLSNPLKESLEQEGFEVTVAVEGGEGLKQSLSKEYKILLLDINLPAISGVTILQKVRAQEWGKDLPVIFLTSQDTDEEMLDKINSLNPRFYFVKGNTSLSEVIDAVKEILI